MTPPPSPTRSWSLTADWILPVAGAPLHRGRLVLAGERIVALEPRGAGAADLDLGAVAVLPGLVNAHVHLDLTGLAGAAPYSGDFTAWLRTVIGHRLARPPEQVREDIRRGQAQSLRHGVTLLGDVAANGASWEVLAGGPGRSVVFHELIGLPADRAEAALSRGQEWLARVRPTPFARPGLSPHAPYSVRADLFDGAAALAHRQGLPLATHLAETLEELDLLARRAGPFVPFLESVGAWDPAGLVGGPDEVLRRCGGALYAHGNYLPEGLDLPCGATVVYCPRTHAFFGHPPHPLPRLLGRGVRVALGTDGLSSNPDLDLLAEARRVRANFPAIAPEVVLRMATLSGAEALGWSDEVGTLEPGKSADLVAVPLDPAPGGGPATDPAAAVLAGNRPVSRVMLRGAWHEP